MLRLSSERPSARLAFAHYLRTGNALPDETLEALETKFNPYHDPTNGQFTFAPGGGAAGGYVGMTSRGRGLIKPTSGGGNDSSGHSVPEQFPPDPYAVSNPAAALAHYVGGTGEDRNFYFNEVNTSGVRLADFPQITKLVSDGKPGLYSIVNAGGSYNGDFSGLHDMSSWATVGGLSLRANGVLTIKTDGSYSFNGRLSADRQIRL